MKKNVTITVEQKRGCLAHVIAAVLLLPWVVIIGFFLLCWLA